MNKLNINSTINRSFFINGTRQLQLIGKKLPEALPVQTYSRTVANTLLDNVHPNQRKLYQQRCRPPPFPICTIYSLAQSVRTTWLNGQRP